MKTKLILIASLALIVALSIFYVQNNNLIADDKDGKDCSSTCTKTAGTTDAKSDCTGKSTTGASVSDDDNAGVATFEFTTDKITCDGCKTEMTGTLKEISGVKDVVYGETCSVSKTTSVKVIYSDKDTTSEIIAASVKEKGLTGNCGDGSKCGSKKKSDVKS